MNLFNIKNIIQEKRLPWFIEKRMRVGENILFFLKNRTINFFRNASINDIRITFQCGFHGETGGVFAIASIANLLAQRYQVEFLTNPSSNYNRLLSSKICFVETPNMNSDLFICDVTCDHYFLERVKKKGKLLIISCHGLLNESHGLESEQVKKALSFADIVHFVSPFQQDSFQLETGRFEIIPNATKKINKKRRTNNVGCVGNLNEVKKNVIESVNIGLASKADYIHLWSIEKDIWKDSRVVTHNWEKNKDKIYNSFDVLVFMSQVETFGLVVIEAMSAGIPCLLSSIPVFEEFGKCPGVTIIDTDNKENTAAILNEMLENKDKLRDPILEHFTNRYSEDVISEKWFSLVSKLLGR